MKTFLLLCLILLNTAHAEVEKGYCRIIVNGVEHSDRMHMWEDENVIAPITITTSDAMGKMRKFRIIYHYIDALHELTISFVDCSHLYQAPGTTMNICSHIFSTTQIVPLKRIVEMTLGGRHSNEPEIQVSCFRDKD